MIEYKSITLGNGLRVVVNRDQNTVLTAVNILYGLGSKHDPVGKTGMAHLLEHLMFTGTAMVPDIDDVFQMAAGENNAFTNQDITNYYGYAPKDNLELLLYIEADRMANLLIPEDKFKTQKKVVLEEYQESLFSSPYSDFWCHLGPLLYGSHPYSWPTIGHSTEDISSISLEDLWRLYNTYITPQSACLSISGPMDYDHVFELVSKHFGAIEKTTHGALLSLPQLTNDSMVISGNQTISLVRDVPENCVFIAFPMVHRKHPDYHVFDLFSELLCYGKSAAFYRRMTKDLEILTEFDAWISGNEDPGLLIMEMHIDEYFSIESCIDIFWEELDKVIEDPDMDTVLRKIKNKIETNIVLSETSIVTKGMSLSYYDYLGALDEINKELDNYERVSSHDIRRIYHNFINPDRAGILIYERKK